MKAKRKATVASTTAPPLSPMAAPEPAQNSMAMSYEPPIQRLGRELVASAIERAGYDADRAVALVHAYTVLVACDGRARV